MKQLGPYRSLPYWVLYSYENLPRRVTQTIWKFCLFLGSMNGSSTLPKSGLTPRCRALDPVPGLHWKGVAETVGSMGVLLGLDPGTAATQQQVRSSAPGHQGAFSCWQGLSARAALLFSGYTTQGCSW